MRHMCILINLSTKLDIVIGAEIVYGFIFERYLQSLLILNLLLILLKTYTKLDSNTLLSSYLPYSILPNTNSLLIICFLGIRSNIYLVSLVRSIIITKNIRIIKRQIGMMSRFA